MTDTAIEPRGALRFRFRGREVALDRFSPRATVLDWLREDALAKGTKEGCGEGDCGACTVVLARLEGGRIRHGAVNACILLLGQLDGAELITVEDLADGGVLHPVQQAMVDQHGSQCGFCTPGIVMSLFAAYHSGAPATPASLNDQLAGNLCRCTGYRPILAAGLATCDGAPTDRFAAAAESRAAALAALADGRDLFVGDDTRFFAAPASLESLAALYRRFPGAALVAGATDVGLWITKQLRDLGQVIWLGRVAGLDAVGETADGALSLGAGVTLLDAAPRLAAIHPDLGELLRRFGSVQVRTSGTVGGNIANGSPIGDLAPALIALGARVVLRRGDAARSLALEDFFIAYGKQDRAPGEFVTAIETPRLGEGQRYRAFKVTKRFDEDISAVMLAARLDLDGRRIAGARIACGGMAATPKRAANAERALVGASLDSPDTWAPALAALGQDFTPLTDMRASAAYRMTVARNVLRKALLEVAGDAAPTRLGALHAAE
ncbi:xanthine dehydrogenase small subunit [Roseiarcus fermentans]|uniref:Xanthine dehydrogenase small subunit n=1 Tax=Roseiarcus fermentans TaxID=1473586 RepID=A0A366F615_9HYPH|nr:xanthine dehydrogenase small subunit [Roseiarcus fermentans]RBP09145.1 xanthine dehydrogenase small subunit [Roseiarcus fermentans]